jgi:hypothetical protein
MIDFFNYYGNAVVSIDVEFKLYEAFLAFLAPISVYFFFKALKSFNKKQ